MEQPTQWKPAIDRLSAEAIYYQACHLTEVLTAIDARTYADEACQIRQVLLGITNHVSGELWHLVNAPKSSNLDAFRIRKLGRVLQEVFSFVRFLQSSDPRVAPPGLQIALTALTERHFPAGQGHALTLVRPQWKYNLTYRPLTWGLRQLIRVVDLDPDETLGAQTSDELIKKLWDKVVAREQSVPNTSPRFPDHIAVLSFAGLDTEDTLLLPLLAHELGHFIDFARPLPTREDDSADDRFQPLSSSSAAREASDVTIEQLTGALNAAVGDALPAETVESLWRGLLNRIESCRREVLADLLGVRMLGFPFFVAQAEFLKTIFHWEQPQVTREGYPGLSHRLRLSFEELTLGDGGLDFRSHIQQQAGTDVRNQSVARSLLSYLDAWAPRLDGRSNTKEGGRLADSRRKGEGDGRLDSIGRVLDDLAEEAIVRVMPVLRATSRTCVPADRVARVGASFYDRIRALEADLPPFLAGDHVAESFSESLAAAWAYQLLSGDSKERLIESPTARREEYRKTCWLLLKAIELAGSPRPITNPPEVPDIAISETRSAGGVLSASSIRERILRPIGDPRFLGVIPMDLKFVQPSSLDVRLGHWFKVARRARLPSLDLGKSRDERERQLSPSQETIFVREDDRLTMHPGDLVLGATLEFVALPYDLMAFVEGKSSLGRMGLIVATATQVSPGFHGVIVLELVNAGLIPLELRPGMEIGQLVILSLDQPVPQNEGYRGPYYCQIRP